MMSAGSVFFRPAPKVSLRDFEEDLGVRVRIEGAAMALGCAGAALRSAPTSCFSSICCLLLAFDRELSVHRREGLLVALP